MVAARFLIRLLNLVSIFVLARLLTPQDFGVAAAASSLLLIAQGVTELQFSAALIRKREIADSDWDAAWTLNLIRGFLLAVLIASLAPALADLIQAPESAGALAVASLVVLIAGAENPRFVLFARSLSLRQDFMLSVWVQTFSVIAAITVALVRPDYWALIVGVLVSAAGRTVLSFVMIRYRPRLGLAGARGLFGFSGWLMGARALSVINDQSDKFFVLARLDTATLGIYRIGQSVVMMPTTDLIEPLTRGLFPAFSQIQKDPARMRAAYLRAQQMVLLIALPIGFGMPFIASPLIGLALGPSWADAALIVQFLAPVLALQMITAGVEALVMATGDTRRIFIRALTFAVLRIPLLLAGVLMGGLLGLLIARMITGMLNVWINLALLQRALGLSVTSAITNAARVWMAALMMVAVLGALLIMLPAIGSLAQIGLTVAAGAVVYVATLAGLWLASGRPDGVERQMLAIVQGAARDASALIKSRGSNG